MLDAPSLPDVPSLPAALALPTLPTILAANSGNSVTVSDDGVCYFFVQVIFSCRTHLL